MRILLSITSLGVGGAERVVTALADRYVAAGHEVMLVHFHGAADLRPSDPGVRLENLDMQRSPLGVLVALRRFRQLIQSFRPDVVNSHLVHANLLTRLLRPITPMPRLISSAHNTNEEGRRRMIAYRLTDRLVDLSTNVSDEAVGAFEHQGAVRPGRMIAIHNGIDTGCFVFDSVARDRIRSELGLDGATPLLLAVGRLWEQKDYPNLLHAFSHLPAEAALPRLAVVGDGPLRAELKGLAESLGVSRRLDFLGVRHDVPSLMAACDVFVLSSAWEGFGLVVAEAMACERLVVATDCGGVREVVGDAGFLVPPREPDALGEGIERALRLPREQRERLGTAARKRVVERYSLETTADRYLAVYRGNEPTNLRNWHVTE